VAYFFGPPCIGCCVRPVL